MEQQAVLQSPLPEGLGELLGGARPTCDLQAVLTGALERIHAEFGSLLHQAAASTDDDK